MGMFGELDTFLLIASTIKRAASRGGVATVIAPKDGQVSTFPEDHVTQDNVLKTDLFRSLLE